MEIYILISLLKLLLYSSHFQKIDQEDLKQNGHME